MLRDLLRRYETKLQILSHSATANLLTSKKGNSPDEANSGSKKAGLEFLVDHWAYNDVELVRLFDMVIDWKNEKKEDRDLVFVGGGILTLCSLPLFPLSLSSSFPLSLLFSVS